MSEVSLREKVSATHFLGFELDQEGSHRDLPSRLDLMWRAAQCLEGPTVESLID